MDGMEKKTDTSRLNQAPIEPEGQMSTETIGSLMEECEELTQQIDSEKDRLERFMLETGGESDASDRIQENIDSLKAMLAKSESRLQALFDAQEKEAFAPEGKDADGRKDAKGRVSVKKRLAEKKARIAMGKPREKQKERKSLGMDMEK